MPGSDKTGPLGQGAQTGRKSGRCNTGIEPGTGVSSSGRWFAGRGRKENSSNRIGDGSGQMKGSGRSWRHNRGRQI